MDWNINGNVNFIIIVESLLLFYSIAVGFAKHIYMIPKAETLVTKRKNILFFRCFISIILVLVGYYFLSYDYVIFKKMEQSVSNGICFVLALLLVLLYVIKVRNRQMTVDGEINSSIKELIKKNNRCVRKIMQQKLLLLELTEKRIWLISGKTLRIMNRFSASNFLHMERTEDQKYMAVQMMFF